MAEAQSLPLLSQYSDVFTRLHEGKKQCAQYGMNRVVLNRFIQDSAESTAPRDTAELVSMVDVSKVDGDGDADQKLEQCRNTLLELVALQEEAITLQKVAREKGISGGLLAVVGQASIQSPTDHGASVINQLSVLMAGNSSPGKEPVPVSSDPVAATDAANDEQDNDVAETTTTSRVLETLRENWHAIGVDVAVCFAASIFAIRLIS